MINSAVSGQKRLSSKSETQKWLIVLCPYTGLLLRPTLIYNGNPKALAEQCFALKVNTLWTIVDLCQSASNSHHYITLCAVESPKASERLHRQHFQHHLHHLPSTKREQLWSKGGTKSFHDLTWPANLCACCVTQMQRCWSLLTGWERNDIKR